LRGSSWKLLELTSVSRFLAYVKKSQFKGERERSYNQAGGSGRPHLGFAAVLLGFASSSKDIHVWDQSPLFESVLDGSHNQIDSPFFLIIHAVILFG
jgi:hypothetical protein